MSCSRLENTALLLRGELDGSDIEHAQQHLETCAFCFARLAHAAAELSEEPASHGLRPDLSSWLASSGLASPASEPSSERRHSGLRFPARASGSLGPFVIEGLLGQGGMGVVYRARHRESGELVALKTVNAPELSSFEGLRQEIRFLKDAHQPGIVRVVDYDLSAGDPWYAMELLEGETLADRHRTLWGSSTLPPASGQRTTGQTRAAAGELSEVLRIYLELCAPLDFIHRLGIVHCDLKPANVFLRDQRDPVLMDFGLVVPARGTIDRETLNPAVRRRGTLPYMSPEVIEGRIPDVRADLYALGCMLYESVTGRPPFVAATRKELSRMHSSSPHTPASELVSGVPPALDDLLARLLAKAPQDRIGHAHQVSELLLAVGAESDARRDSSLPSYLFRPQIVGRSESLRVVSQALERVSSGAGLFILVAGESGIGKTFFASEVAQRAASLGVRVVTGECQPSAVPNGSGTAALQGIRNFLDVVRDACRRGGQDVTDRLLGNYLGVLKQYSPALGGLPGAENYPEPAPLPDAAGRQRLLHALRTTLQEFARLRPCLLILDDLQWADELTLALLDTLDAEFFAATPLVLLGTRRSSEGSSALGRLAEKDGVSSVTLERLGADHTAAMVEQMLGVRSASEALIDFIAAQAEGVPFFVAEYLRAVLADGVLAWRNGSWSFDGQSHSLDKRLRGVAFPKRLQELVRHRLDELSAHAKHGVRAAAVLGRELDVGILSKVLEQPEEQVRAMLSEGISRGIFELGRAGYLRFAHDKFREFTYSDLQTDERRRLHARVADALDQQLRGSVELEARAGELARHYQLADDSAKAIDYYERAAERALLTAADAEAVVHLSYARELAGGSDARLPVLRRARWARGMADAKLGLGEANSSVEHLAEAAALLGHPVPQAAWAQGLKLGAQLLLQVFRRLTGVSRITSPSEIERRIEAGRVFERFSRAAYYAGQNRQLLLGCIYSLNLLETTGLAPELALAYTNVAAVCGILPAPKWVEKYFVMAGDALRETPDPANESLLRLLQAVFYTGAGQAQRAKEFAERGVAIADLIGFQRRFNECTAVRTGIEIHAGRVALAWRGIEQLHTAARARHDVQLEAWANLQRLECLTVTRDVEAARQQFQHSWPLLPDARPERLWASSLGALAHFRAGDLAAATEMALVATRLALAEPPVHLHCVNAYDLLTQTLIGLNRVPAKQLPATPAVLRSSLKRVLAQVRRSARVFRIAQPLAALQLGTVDWLRGKRERAIASWQTGASLARELDLPYHEARILSMLGDAEPGSERGRESRARVEQLLSDLTLEASALPAADRFGVSA